MRFRIRRHVLIKLFICTAFVYISLATITHTINPVLIVRDVLYLTRPAWDSPGRQPAIVIPHFHSDSMPLADLCQLHGWQQRRHGDGDRGDLNVSRVIDAVIFSVELDILEIRFRELWDVVDIFLVLEADRTFTGAAKPLVLQENLSRFEFAAEKLRHVTLRNSLKEKPSTDFGNEIQMRQDMTEAIQSMRPKYGDLIIVGDVDEIPYKHTINLIRNCEGYSRELHLQMRNYVYSFEFYVDTAHWRPHVDTYSRNFKYHHGMPTEANDAKYQLADAGWHCSYCFRYLSDFVFKMTSFSHSDRVTAKHLLNKENIQRKICDGSNIYDMYEEVYTFKELIGTLGNRRRTLSTVGIPAAVIDQHKHFKFLLPGGCVREDAPAGSFE